MQNLKHIEKSLFSLGSVDTMGGGGGADMQSAMQSDESNQDESEQIFNGVAVSFLIR